MVVTVIAVGAVGLLQAAPHVRHAAAHANVQLKPLLPSHSPATSFPEGVGAWGHETAGPF